MAHCPNRDRDKGHDRGEWNRILDPFRNRPKMLWKVLRVRVAIMRPEALPKPDPNGGHHGYDPIRCRQPSN